MPDLLGFGRSMRTDLDGAGALGLSAHVTAPLYRDRAAGRARIAGLGGTTRLFAFDTPIARAACAAMCRARRTAAVLAAAASPRLPVAIARRGVLHTWPSYRQAMDTVVLDLAWPSVLPALTKANVAVHLVAGSDDAVIDPAILASARRVAGVEVNIVDSAGHELPMTDPLACRATLRAQR